MPSVCTGVVEKPPQQSIVAGTQSLVQKKRNGLKTMSEKETPKVVGLILTRYFYTMSEKETLEFVRSILESHLL